MKRITKNIILYMLITAILMMPILAIENNSETKNDLILFQNTASMFTHQAK